MPPNFTETSISTGINFVDGPKDTEDSGSSTNSALKITRSLTTLVTHILVGIIVGTSLHFALRGGVPLGATMLHIVLCVIGYQFLMAEAILALAPDSWTSSLSLKHKRWLHTWLQIIGSVLAITGSMIMSADKAVNFNTVHGKTSLAATVFTTVSLVNGLASMYAYELRKVLPGILSRLTHILFGSVAVVMASVSLAYGFDKGFFRATMTPAFADTLIVMTAIYTTIVIINPLLTFYAKSKGAIES